MKIWIRHQTLPKAIKAAQQLSRKYGPYFFITDGSDEGGEIYRFAVASPQNI